MTLNISPEHDEALTAHTPVYIQTEISAVEENKKQICENC